MRVVRIGDDLAVELSDAVVKALHLKEGDEVDIVPAARRSSVQPTRETEAKPEGMTREEALQRLDELRFPLPDDYKFDREEANAR